MNTPDKYLTICKFCHAHVALAPPLGMPVVGAPGKRAGDLLQVLGRHVAKHHPEQFKRGTVFMDEVLSFVLLSAFEHEDPSVPARLERIRAEIFAQVRKNTISDSMLQHLTAGFGLDAQQERDVNQALQAVRDACCEFGQHAPGNTSPAQPSPLIISA